VVTTSTAGASLSRVDMSGPAVTIDGLAANILFAGKVRGIGDARVTVARIVGNGAEAQIDPARAPARGGRKEAGPDRKLALEPPHRATDERIAMVPAVVQVPPLGTRA